MEGLLTRLKHQWEWSAVSAFHFWQISLYSENLQPTARVFEAEEPTMLRSDVEPLEEPPQVAQINAHRGNYCTFKFTFQWSPASCNSKREMVTYSSSTTINGSVIIPDAALESCIWGQWWWWYRIQTKLKGKDWGNPLKKKTDYRSRISGLMTQKGKTWEGKRNWADAMRGTAVWELPFWLGEVCTLTSLFSSFLKAGSWWSRAGWWLQWCFAAHVTIWSCSCLSIWTRPENLPA